jgi:hypothetical protein
MSWLQAECSHYFRVLNGAVSLCMPAENSLVLK